MSRSYTVSASRAGLGSVVTTPKTVSTYVVAGVGTVKEVIVPTHVQSANSASNSVGFVNKVGLGNTVIVTIFFSGATNPVTDDKSNSYPLLDTAVGGGYTWASYYLQNINNAPQTISTSGAVLIMVDEFSGVGGLDGHSGLYTASAGATASTGTWTTTSNGDLIWTGGGSTSNVSTGSGFTAGNTATTYLTEYQIQPTAGSAQGVVSATAGQSTWLLGMAFKPAGVFSGISGSAWNPLDKTNVTLSNGNLTATATGQGGVRSVNSYSAGKYYWEFTIGSSIGGNFGIGAANASAALGTMGPTPLNAIMHYSSGSTYVNNSSTVAGPSYANGNVVSVALDLGAKLVWFRNVSTSNTWNSNAAYDPGAGTGGISVSPVTGALFAAAGTGASGEIVTANFGTTAFAGTIPSGFTAGWPAAPPVTGKKQRVWVFA